MKIKKKKILRGGSRGGGSVGGSVGGRGGGSEWM